MENCEIPRWQLLKSQLSNLSYTDFIEQCKSDKKAVCLDVRTPEEFEQNGIEGAININYLSHDLADMLEALDSSRHYYVYCRTGRRSLRVCVILSNLGFRHVHNMLDGISAKP